MPAYANRSGTSSVIAYKMHSDSIDIMFKDGSLYTYSNDSAGEDNIAIMKDLAQKGQGLNGFINTYVHDLYE